MAETACKWKDIPDSEVAQIAQIAQLDDKENMQSQREEPARGSCHESTPEESDCFAVTADRLPGTESQKGSPHSGRTDDTKCCNNGTCLLWDTPRVGFFNLEQRSLEDSVIGRGESGTTFKIGKGKITKGNVNAARNLLSREFPQVFFFITHTL